MKKSLLREMFFLGIILAGTHGIECAEERLVRSAVDGEDFFAGAGLTPQEQSVIQTKQLQKLIFFMKSGVGVPGRAEVYVRRDVTPVLSAFFPPSIIEMIDGYSYNLKGTADGSLRVQKDLVAFKVKGHQERMSCVLADVSRHADWDDLVTDFTKYGWRPARSRVSWPMKLMGQEQLKAVTFFDRHRVLWQESINKRSFLRRFGEECRQVDPALIKKVEQEIENADNAFHEAARKEGISEKAVAAAIADGSIRVVAFGSKRKKAE